MSSPIGQFLASISDIEQELYHVSLEARCTDGQSFSLYYVVIDGWLGAADQTPINVTVDDADPVRRSFGACA